MALLNFREKPHQEIQAMQWTGVNIEEIWEWLGADKVYGPTEKNPDWLIIEVTIGGGTWTEVARVYLNTWIVKGIKDERVRTDLVLMETEQLFGKFEEVKPCAHCKTS